MNSSGSTRPSSRHRDGYIREQRPDAALDLLGAGLREHGIRAEWLYQQPQAPPDMMTGQSIRTCLRREVPTEHRVTTVLEYRSHAQAPSTFGAFPCGWSVSTHFVVDFNFVKHYC